MNLCRNLSYLGKAVLVLCVLLSSLNSDSLAKEVISPEKFSGSIASGYRAAQKAKDVCAKLFCYCGCDMTDEHTSLLDCFTSMHGVDCAICQEEAIIACNMKTQGKSLAQIQKAIDEQFSAQYPWEEASPAFESYLKAAKMETNLEKRRPVSTKNSTKNRSVAKKTKGQCCGH